MIDHNHNLTPRERLAKIVAEETDGGRRVVKFFVSVTGGELEGFKPHHRMDAARELVNIGLEQFEDYIEANPSTPRQSVRKAKRPADDNTEASPELHAARAELAQYAREITYGGRKIVRASTRMSWTVSGPTKASNPTTASPRHKNLSQSASARCRIQTRHRACSLHRSSKRRSWPPGPGFSTLDHVPSPAP